MPRPDLGDPLPDLVGRGLGVLVLGRGLGAPVLGLLWVAEVGGVEVLLVVCWPRSAAGDRSRRRRRW